MKEDRGAEKPLPKPAYNVQTGTEGQFVVRFSIHQRAGDTTGLIPHLEGVKAKLSVIARRKPEILPQQDHQPRCLPQNISADAGYGSEENYAYIKSIANRNMSAKPSSVLRTCPTMLQKTSLFARLTNV